jgi:hypothetical protein
VTACAMRGSPRARPAAQPPAASQRAPDGLLQREGSPVRGPHGGSFRGEGSSDGAASGVAPGWHRRAPSDLPPEIAPPAPRADMVLAAPTVLHRCARRQQQG